MLEYTWWEVLIGLMLVGLFGCFRSPIRIVKQAMQSFAQTEDVRQRRRIVLSTVWGTVTWIIVAFYVFNTARLLSQPLALAMYIGLFVFVWRSWAPKSAPKTPPQSDA